MHKNSLPLDLDIDQQRPQSLLQFVISLLDMSDMNTAQSEAWMLLEFVTGKERPYILTMDSTALLPAQLKKLEELCRLRREENKPLQYLLGGVQFGDLALSVQEPVLIPRPETEEWTLWLIEELKKGRFSHLNINNGGVILDLCSGSGCIGLALAKSFDGSQIVGVDKNAAAVELAQRNAQALGLNNTMFVENDLEVFLSGFLDNIALIVCNPPYITPSEMSGLAPELQWEDRDALVAGEGGLACYRALLRGIKKYVKQQKVTKLPVVVLEIGMRQRDAVIALFESAGFCVLGKKDFNGLDRVICAWEADMEIMNEVTDA
jgi:release factor glutamine methyltransferase